MFTAQRNRKQQSRRPRAQLGMSLAEILVAMTVFVIATAVALILYNALTQSYKRGDNAADVQQNTRIAFDRLVTDLRMAGFNYNPDGDENRPDEQIEGAWDTAVSFRADFDFEDPTASLAPESTLDGGSFLVVSTGNDEIVTYALAKPDGTGGTDLTFVADVEGVPRDASTETITISNIALVQDDPPYTLYRITVNPDSTAVTRTPVADNIYSLNFRYLDAGAASLGPETPADASDDIGGSEASAVVDTRELIRRIEIAVVGMTPDPDLNYTDPDDPYPPSEKHRKFTLVQDVTPRNIGYVGRPDLDIVPPSLPTNLAACPGQCDSMLLTWDPAPAGDLVNQYVSVKGTSPTALGSPAAHATNVGYVEGMTPGGYYFKVRAEDSSGNISPLSALATPGPAVVADVTTPTAAGSLTASGGSGGIPVEDDRIELVWLPTTTNVESVVCDPSPTLIRDLAGYRLYRSDSPGAIATAGFLHRDEIVLSAGTSSYDDTDAVPCRTYYYDITAVDKCGNESAPQATTVDGSANGTYAPEMPFGLTALPSGPDTVSLDWNEVIFNTCADRILVDTYRVYRAALTSGMSPSSAASAIDWSTATTIDVMVSDPTAPAFVDTTAFDPGPGVSYYYRVAGLTDCSSPFDEGEMSDSSEGALCTFDGSIYVMTPYDGETVTGTVDVSVEVFPTGTPPEVFQGYVVISGPGGVVHAEGTGASPLPAPINFTWDATAAVPGDYTVTGNFVNSAGCSDSLSSLFTVTAPVACCIAPLAPALGAGGKSARDRDILFSLVNNCAQDLTVSRMDIFWTDNTGNGTRLEEICWDQDAAAPPEDCNLFSLATFIPPVISPSSKAFIPALDLLATRDDLDPLIMGFAFDLALTDGSAIGETITVDIFYQTPGAIGDAQCRFLVDTLALDIGVVTP